MKILEKLKEWFFAKRFKEGKQVYWDNPYVPDYSGIYIIVERPDKKGLVGIYNKKNRLCYAHWHELEKLSDDEFAA